MSSLNRIQPTSNDSYQIETINEVDMNDSIDGEEAINPERDLPNSKENFTKSKTNANEEISKKKEHIRVPLPRHIRREKLREVTASCCHSFYDSAADVEGIILCTCCEFTWNRWWECCSNIISCPVYFYCCFIIPLVILMLSGIIVLYLLGSKTIGNS